MNERQKQLVRALQGSLTMVDQPFDLLAEQAGWPVDEALDQARCWLAGGTIKRYGAVVAHRKLGFAANGMAVFSVPAERIDAAGRQMAQCPEISHCYRRPEMDGWPYNLFAMVHGRSEAEVNQFVADLAGRLGLGEYDILFSTTEYKKTSMQYFT